MCESDQEQISELQSELSSFQSDAYYYQERADDLELELTNAQNELEDLRMEISGLEEDIWNLQCEKENLEEELSWVDNKIDPKQIDKILFAIHNEQHLDSAYAWERCDKSPCRELSELVG